jgi:hypothetical protein
MTTVIKNNGSDADSSGGVGLILGVLLAIVLIVLFFVYALPALRAPGPADNGGINVDVDLPGGGGGTGGSPAPSGGVAPGPAY